MEMYSRVDGGGGNNFCHATQTFKRFLSIFAILSICSPVNSINVEPETAINYTKVFNPSIEQRVIKLINSLSRGSRRGKES